MSEPGVRFLDHAADVGFDVDAASPAELFRAAAGGMFALVFGSEAGGEGRGESRSSPGRDVAGERHHDPRRAGRGAVEAFEPARARARLRPIRLAADDLAQLLVAWLSELLFLFDAEGAVPVVVDLRVEGRQLDAAVRLAAAPGEPVKEIKGVTYHQLDVHEEGGRWHGRVIFDV